MMDRQTLTDTMGQRLLKAGEVLSSGYALLSNRFGSYLLLSFLVYLPANLITGYFAMQIDLTPLLEVQNDLNLLTEAYESLLGEYVHLIGAQLAVMFLTLVAAMVTAVIVKNQLFDEENRSFGKNFYQGVRMWPRGALSLILVLIELILGSFGCAMLMIVPLIGLVAFVLMIALVFIFQMNYSLSSAAAALRGRFGFDNLRYIRFLSAPVYPQTIGIFAIVTLISNGILMIVSLLTTNLVTFSDNQWVMLAVSTLIDTILSILSVYGFVCGAIVFLNLEELHRPKTQPETENGPSELKEEVDTEDRFHV